MFNKRSLLILFLMTLCLCVIPVIGHAQVEESTPMAISTVDAFELGNAAYKNGDFQGALAYYVQALEIHGPLQEIYYNIGNAYFRLNKKGMARANFLRAQRLAPRSRQIAKNITYLNSLIEYKIDDESSWYLVQLRRLLGFFTMTEISVIMWSAVGLLLLLLFAWLFTDGKVRSVVNIVLIVQICIVVVSVSSFVAKKYIATPGHPAVVLEQGVQVRYGPSTDDKVMFKLVEGLELYVVDRRTEWSRITLLNKETGWVQNGQIEMV